MLDALLVALVAVVAAGGWRLAHRLRDLEERVAGSRTLGRRLDELRASVERGLAVTRTHLAAVAGGEAPERAAILRGSPYQEIKAADALALWERTSGLFVLDVRTSGEFANGHIPNAHLVPVDELEDRLGELPPPDTTMLVTCAAGGRSTAACQLLGEKGYVRLLNLSGGMHTWPGPRVGADDPGGRATEDRRARPAERAGRRRLGSALAPVADQPRRETEARARLAAPEDLRHHPPLHLEVGGGRQLGDRDGARPLIGRH